jgi:hypothetical protein
MAAGKYLGNEARCGGPAGCGRFSECCRGGCRRGIWQIEFGRWRLGLLLMVVVVMMMRRRRRRRRMRMGRVG